LRPSLAKEHPGLEAIVMRLLAREREQRFASAAAFLEATEPQRPISQQPAPQRPAPRSVTVIEKSPTLVPSPPPRSPVSKWVWAAALAVVGLGIGAGVWYWQSTPSTAIPELTPRAGTYPQAQLVTITDATPNAVIHFTKDGSPPTAESDIYFLPISSLPSGGVVRAMATAPGHRPSRDITGVYTWTGTAQPATKPAGTSSAAANSDYDQGKSAFDHKDYAKARTLFKQACDSDNMNACNYLGYLYANGLGVSPDEAAAGKIYQKACDKGSLSSCAGLGSVYQDAGDITNARKYFKKACDGGLAEACDLLRATQ
jgi:hypothetical protein